MIAFIAWRWIVRCLLGPDALPRLVHSASCRSSRHLALLQLFSILTLFRPGSCLCFTSLPSFCLFRYTVWAQTLCLHMVILSCCLKKSVLPAWYNDWRRRVSEVWAWVCEPTYANSENASVTQLCLLDIWKMDVAWTATEILSSGETGFH